MASDARPWWRRPLCALMLCPHEAKSDDWACWGECIHCGNVAGRTSRASIRAFIEREEAREAAALGRSERRA